MPSDTPLLSVIIVSYNTRQMTLDCLRDLYKDLGTLDAEVLVIDNDSKDGSADAVTASFPQATLIRNEVNAGFGAANNIGLQRARGQYFMLLNTDAFLHAGACTALLRYLETNAHVGAVGPRLLNKDGSLQRSCYLFPSPSRAWLENLGIAGAADGSKDYSRWAHDSDRAVDWVGGACIVVRRQVYMQVGGFDEAFFMYQEETDWQRRMQVAGWSIDFTPDATVTHLGGASGASEQAKINAHFFDSLDYYTLKHHGYPGLLSLRFAMVLGSAGRAFLWSVVIAVDPKRRVSAGSKAKLQAWLFVRQATHWRNAGKAVKA
jgi:GT2 family glycosyltransferase